jgi:hypothetical protein
LIFTARQRKLNFASPTQPMPEVPKKPKSFATAQPKIPGVPVARPKNPAEGNPTEWPLWMRQPYVLAGAGAAVLVLIIAIIWWAHGARHVAQLAAIDAPQMAQAKPAPAAAPAAGMIPTAPGKIGTTDELAQDWSAKKFYFRDAGMKSSPAMVVHLPGNTYWAFSLREPYGTCELEYVTDMNKLKTDYNYDATHPMVGDPCTHTVYDLTAYGPGPNGLVRGAAVAGPSVRPPFAIEIEIRGKDIIATRSE